MILGMTNDVIKKIDIVKRDCADMKIECTFQRSEKVQLKLISIELIEKLLNLLQCDSLSKVKNIPVRLILNELKESRKIELVAIGDLLNDRWLMLATYSEKEITGFEKMIAPNTIKDVAIWL